MAIKFGRLVQQGLKNPLDFIRTLFALPKFIKLFYRLFHDSRVALQLKIMLILTLAYVISPIDLIPDLLIPFFGQIDDLIILIAGLRYFLRNCPPEAVQEHVLLIERGAS